MSAKSHVWTVLAAVAASSVTAFFVGRAAGAPTSCKDDSARLDAVTRELARLVDFLSERAAPPPRAAASAPTPTASTIPVPAAASSPTGGRVAAGLAPAPHVERDDAGL